MAFVPSSRLDTRVDELLTHYPPNHRRAGSLWLCHLVQDEVGHLGPDQIEWIANKLGLSKMDVQEVVTFYPMFRPDPSGKVHLRVCRSELRSRRLREAVRNHQNQTRHRHR